MVGKRRRLFTCSTSGGFGPTLVGFRLAFYSHENPLLELALTIAGRCLVLGFWPKGHPYP